jgi:nitrite reductase/ring-hydroxylating ferredoxin subunit
LGAHLGVGGKVVNEKCIQCPFHGWLYDGETGVCVDYNGKPMEVENVEYNADFCEKDKKLDWVKKDNKTATLRKYPAC